MCAVNLFLEQLIYRGIPEMDLPNLMVYRKLCADRSDGSESVNSEAKMIWKRKYYAFKRQRITNNTYKSGMNSDIIHHTQAVLIYS